ncbi:MAG: hypothetical protein U5L05_17900 [Rubrivivax sp.]|nr:hypothetical protein [Rubrivivax sp.]
MNANPIVTSVSSAASRPGAACPHPAAAEPITGPIATPALVAAESQPSVFARSLGSVASATYAWITPTVPPPAPCTRREKKISSSELEKAKMMYAMPLAAMPTSRAGRRPRRSETRPHIGALTSCAMAKLETIRAITEPSPPIPTASSARQSGPWPTNRAA